MTRKFICVQGSPEIPKGVFATQYKPNTLYLVHSASGDIIGDYKPWQIEGNSCWEEVKEEPAGRWIPERGTFYYYIDNRNIILSQMWSSDDTDNALLEACNVFRTMEEAGDEVRRRNSIANAWWPEEGEGCWVWRSYNNNVRHEEYGASYMPERYIGACHKTKEACEAWGKEYAHLFNKRPKHD